MMKEKKTAQDMASNDERAPLLQVVAVRPHRDRYNNHTVSSFVSLDPDFIEVRYRQTRLLRLHSSAVSAR